MTERTTKILSEALELSSEERASLAAELMASLDNREDEASARAWLEEMERRARAALSGEDAGEDWTEVITTIRDELKTK